MGKIPWFVAGCFFLLAASLRADAGGRPLQRIAFGSCAHEDKPQPIWEAILATKPDLFLFLGDNVYGDTTDMEVLRAKYAKLAAVPGYQKLRKTCPILATWDDHDYGANDAGAEYPKKAESQQIFLDFFGEAKDSPRRQQEGIYHARVFGPADKSVQVILLDTRYFRGPLKKRFRFLPFEGPYEPNPDATVTMLGEAQWQWLQRQLRVPARLRLLVSSIQVVAEDHHHEKWLNLPHERERLFQVLRQTQAGGVIILSGDRHLGELSLMDAGIGYPLYDLTSSGLNMGTLRWRRLEVNRHRVATMNQGHNFGLVAIDWSRQDPLVGLQIRDEEGDITIQEKLPLRLLQPGVLKGKSTGLVRLADGTPLTLAQIKSNLNKEVKLVLVVRATGQSKNGLIFLNSAENRLSDDNFTVVLDKTAQAQLKEAGVAAPRTHFAGRTIAVTGTLSLFQDRPQIIVADAKQIQIVAKSPEANPPEQ